MMAYNKPSKFGVVSAVVGALVFLAVVAWFISGAQGQDRSSNKCYPYNELVTMLEKQYGEHPKADGVIRNHAAQLFVSLDKSTWSLILVRTDGVACFIAAGTDWSEVPLPVPGKDA